ncbi:signal transduction histidine kinase/phage shock protein PspC (stress-responsive transcriptional regulator) [Arcanobacterium wilhelmae]|uniref:Signal transduction histidine kinase/phage shock protein PspC (Stress-responsive transcriptional regulator) n=1 Tax=Arcanobacterium wilhelmae TaxID=1803177 RepID=A0ABT9NBN8_9ACTO|nr:ATP-binding protein [Arcanobacterium wilhelmae]MDP9800631.1 signal transduction histidine kinase/phage shock protein PspC (stress-responsive transcriptional regulator) [Arcanobacterium wilhelmae]WFN90038.1 ATP-binding protein [Arcanobacterium wilhelmae]
MSNTDFSYLRAPGVPERAPLERRHPRILAGVAQGVAVHLGGSAALWRAGFLLACGFYGAGAIAYALLAFMVPNAHGTDAGARLAPRLGERMQKRAATPSRKTLVTVALFFLGAGAVLALVEALGTVIPTNLVVPFLVIVIGAGIAWAQPGESVSVSWTITGAAVTAVGALLFTTNALGWRATVSGVVVAVAMLVAVGVVLAGVLLRNKNQLFYERERTIRESERADIAAHLHDSVLQTLTLIRARAGDPEEVAALARTQEHDLRRYLYSDRAQEGTSVAEEIRRVAGEVERTFRVEIDVVASGDTAPTSASRALAGAVREALTNAAKHASGKISLFAELSDQECEVFVRDRGAGFDPASIPPDRAGIRDSIRGRIEGAGGEVEIRSPLPSGGTEVRMRIGGRQ